MPKEKETKDRIDKLRSAGLKMPAKPSADAVSRIMALSDKEFKALCAVIPKMSSTTGQPVMSYNGGNGFQKRSFED